MKTALILGISGQDGSYLAEHLVDVGYKVIGTTRRDCQREIENLSRIRRQIEVVDVDLGDKRSIEAALAHHAPTEVYNFAGPSFDGGTSWKDPLESTDSIGVAVTRILEAIRRVDPRIRFFQASSAEMFGRADVSPQNEETPFHPRSPYGVAKLYAHWMAANYREVLGIFAVSGILFNHESPRRRPEFLSRKVTQAAARIAGGLRSELSLGNLDARRDWGFAGDYVRACHLVLQQDAPADYVIGTGELHSVREFVETAFRRVGLDWQRHVIVDPSLVRPTEAVPLVADASRLRSIGWSPAVAFESLVETMIEHDFGAPDSTP
jgi:GDPmannose 4,6-dehydratase